MARRRHEARELAVGRFGPHDAEGFHPDLPRRLVGVAARIAHDVAAARHGNQIGLFGLSRKQSHEQRRRNQGEA